MEITAATRLFVYLTITTFFGFFLIEAILWTYPFVYNLLLPQLNPSLTYPNDVQATVLSALFVNQGVYNLLFGLGGVGGLLLVRAGHRDSGRALICFVCIAAVLAAITLLLTTSAYLLGVVQLLFPAIALFRLRSETH